MMPDATPQLDERGRLPRNLDGSYGRPDVEALLDMVAARMSGERPASSGPDRGLSGQSGMTGMTGMSGMSGQPGMTGMTGMTGMDETMPDADLAGSYPGHGLTGLHPDDLLEAALSSSGQDASPQLLQVMAQKLLTELMRQDPGMAAGRPAHPARQDGLEGRFPGGHGGILSNPPMARRLAMNDRHFEEVFAAVKNQVASLPAYFRGFIRGHLDRDPSAFTAVYGEMRRKVLGVKSRAGKHARQGALVLEQSGAGDPPMLGDIKKARIEELTRKIKANRGSPKDFGDILELSGVLDRMNR